MAISAPGIGSNLDVNSIVQQLMALEQRPLISLDRKEAVAQARISAVGSLKGALSALETASAALVPVAGQTPFQKFGSYKATVTDTTIATVTATSTAVAGVYSLTVDQLAKSQRLESTPDPAISAGTLTIEIGTYEPAGAPTTFTPKPNQSPVTITIGANAATPEGVRDAINAANAGVRATVINGEAGKYLILDGQSTGNDAAFRITGTTGLTYDASTGDTAAFTETVSAQNARATINGISVTSVGNTFTEAVEGLSFTVLKEPPDGEPALATQVTVSRDASGLTTTLNALVKAFNDAAKVMRDLGAFDPSTGQGGLLLGDSALRSSQSTIRNALNFVPAGLTGVFQRLSTIGISIELDGTMKFDTTKLNDATKVDYESVANLVSAYGTAIRDAAASLTGANGLLTQRVDGLGDSVKFIDRQREVLNQRLVAVEARFRKQFTALDTLIASLTQTSSFLQQQLASLPAPNSGANT